ncbi:MAG TPA: pseudouridine synthase [Polyangiaceae bacterium]|nr:pseudouridine synthase [Polyangiaceae bacterium]
MNNQRVACDHADRCGGCPLLDLTYDEQLARKRGRVQTAIARYPSLASAVAEPVAPADPIVGYRTRAKLIVAPGGAIGLFAQGGGHHVVDIPRCRVLAPVLSTVASALRDRIRMAEAAGGALAPFDASGGGALRAVDLREVRGDPRRRDESDPSRVLVTLVVDRSRAGTDPAALRRAAQALLESVPEVIGVAVNFHVGDAPQILGVETTLLAGVDHAADRVGSSVHFATFGSFVQAHRGQAERVHALLAEAVGVPGARTGMAPPRVLDLFAGSGSIGLALAAAGAKVVLVESFAPASEQAAAAARAQGLDVEAVCGDAATVLQARGERGERFDAVVINPPRRGTSPRAREALAKLGPAVIAYVSCDPETLARDLAHLARLGYAAASLRPLDIIPLTDEVETVAVLRPAAIPPPVVVYEDAGVIVVDKASPEPVTPQGEYAGSLLARVRRIPRAEEAVPVHRADAGTSGLVVFARSPEYLARWQRALSEATTRATHVAAVRGITPIKGRIPRAERPSDGGPAPPRTRYRRVSKAAGHSVLRVVAEPMDVRRAPPIRQHLASVGHPVLGDERHGHAPTNRYFAEKCGLDHTFLHCARIELTHPDSGTPLVVEAPLPGDLLAVLERMGGDEAVRSAGPPVKREPRRPRPDA